MMLSLASESDISPFTSARVEYAGELQVGGFTLPRRVQVTDLGLAQPVIQRWELRAVRLLGPGPAVAAAD